jgi:polar amino acid transport system substrate-binding protein
MKPRVLRVAAVLAVALSVAACGSSNSSSGTSSTTAAPGGTASQPCSYSSIQNELYSKGQLTIATDNPVYVPWFYANHPENGLGYEAATAYAVAQYLGFNKSQVHWVYEPFNASYAPGPKKFDFDVNEVSITPARAQAVTFSVGYYDDTQALVVLNSGPIVHAHSPSDLKNYIYGDQIGTTSIEYIASEIQPHSAARPYNQLSDAQSALTAHEIQGIVTDTPTAQYMATQIHGGTVVGQFPPNGEQFGFLFAKGNPLVSCVDKAIEHVKSDGQLASYSQRFLKAYNSIPTIQP